MPTPLYETAAEEDVDTEDADTTRSISSLRRRVASCSAASMAASTLSRAIGVLVSGVAVVVWVVDAIAVVGQGTGSNVNKHSAKPGEVELENLRLRSRNGGYKWPV
jgi:hypothetical protein